MNCSRCLRKVALITAAGVMLVSNLLSAAEKSGIRQAYERGEQAGSSQLGRLVLNQRIEPHWLDDGHRFWFRRTALVDGQRCKEFILVDARTGTRAPAFNHKRLAKALSKAMKKTFDAGHLPFDAIKFVDGTLEVRTSGGVWRVDLDDYTCVAGPKQSTKRRNAPATKRDPGKGKKRGPQGQRSPDGKWRAFIEEQNVAIRRATGGKSIRLTSDGTEEGERYRNVAWSPDSKRLIAWRTTPGADKEMNYIESVPKEGFRPAPKSHVYALPGDRLATHELWLFDVETREATRAKAEPIDWMGAPSLRWRPDGERLTYEQTHRGYMRRRLIEVDASTGKSRAIIDEQGESFLPPMKHFSKYIDDGRQVIWSSERDGWNHLYLHDGETGEIINQITRGEWVVRSIEAVDEKTRTIRFTASGCEPGQDPYHVHHYRVDFDGSNLTALTAGDGTHKVAFSPNGEYIIDTYSRVDLAPVVELRRVDDGSLICEVERADMTPLVESGWIAPEPFCAKGRDGKTDIWGMILRPSTLDPKQKYPVVEFIYAGPHGSHVPKSFAVSRGQQALAEVGFIVVLIDGMGTSNRSKAFHDVAFRNLADGGFPDRIAWMKAAADRYPYIDVSRVGIYGYSAGGYNAARALIDHSDFYKAAVALAGNHDHRTDKVWWNELWMGYPVGDHYREQSNIEDAAEVEGALLLVAGEMDTNVNAHAATMRFVDALIKADKDFDMLLVPGKGHNLSSPHLTRRIWNHFVEHLRGETPPRGFQIKSGSGSECDITVRNNSDAPITIYWITFDGDLKEYEEIAPGGIFKQHSFEGHEWLARADGETVSSYTVSRAKATWVVK